MTDRSHLIIVQNGAYVEFLPKSVHDLMKTHELLYEAVLLRKVVKGGGIGLKSTAVLSEAFPDRAIEFYGQKRSRR